MSATGSTIRLTLVQEKISDLSHCCICMDSYDDPRILPCFHTFCLKCLKQTGANLRPGDSMPCPLCRQDFIIPLEGFAALRKNTLMESLLDMAKSIKLSPPKITKCDACLKERNGVDSAEILVAKKFCADCNHNLCEECCRNHSKFKTMTKHRLLAVEEKTLVINHGHLAVTERAPVVESAAATSFCHQHKGKMLDIFCRDCISVICLSCFFDSHNGHKCSEVEPVAKEFRGQIQSTIDTISLFVLHTQTKKQNLEKRKSELLHKFGDLENKVNAKRDELKQLADRHARTLLQSLKCSRDSKLKEMQIETDELDMHLSSMSSFTSHYTSLTTKASDVEICRLAKDIIIKGVELQQKHHDPDRPSETVEILLDMTAADEFMAADSNIIGELRNQSNPIFTKKSKVKFIEELQEKIEQQNRELKKKKVPTATLR